MVEQLCLLKPQINTIYILTMRGWVGEPLFDFIPVSIDLILHSEFLKCDQILQLNLISLIINFFWSFLSIWQNSGLLPPARMFSVMFVCSQKGPPCVDLLKPVQSSLYLDLFKSVWNHPTSHSHTHTYIPPNHTPGTTSLFPCNSQSLL